MAMETMYIIRWIVTGVGGLVWLYCATGNIAIALAWFTRKSQASLIPFVGGTFGAIAVGTLPIDLGAYRVAWVLLPAVLDIGSIPILVVAAISYFRRVSNKE